MSSKPPYEYGIASQRNLKSCHVLLQKIFLEVIYGYDCSILEGYRNMEEQNIYYKQGLSNAEWPMSKHNTYPSRAIHAAPYPLDWDDIDRFLYFGGFVKGVALKMNVALVWGGDWDGDNDFNDQDLNDYVHFELKSNG